MKRVSFRSGKKIVSRLSGDPADPYCDLVFPKTDSRGHAYIPRYNTVNIPVKGRPRVHKYKIAKASSGKKLTFAPEDWEGPAWKDIQELPLSNNLFTLGKSSHFEPDARAKMQYDDHFLYVFYKVNDQYVRGLLHKDQTAVCIDSCMELFLRPGGKKGRFYFNFEMNCVGALLLAKVTVPEKGGRVKFQMLPEKELKKILRQTSLKKVEGEIKEKIFWYASMQIPWDFLEKYSSVRRPVKGDVWSANLYKCAEWSSHPHWLTWKETTTFHAPEYFGDLIFE